MPSPSVSVSAEVQELVLSFGQKSQAFGKPSPSESRPLAPPGQMSQALPILSPSLSCCDGLERNGQLSGRFEMGQPVFTNVGSPTPSKSASVQVSHASPN